MTITFLYFDVFFVSVLQQYCQNRLMAITLFAGRGYVMSICPDMILNGGLRKPEIFGGFCVCLFGHCEIEGAAFSNL